MQVIFQSLIFQKSTSRAFMEAKSEMMSSRFSFRTKAFSIERIDKADNLSSGPMRVGYGTRGTSYPGPVGTSAREDKSTKAKFFCNQAQT